MPATPFSAYKLLISNFGCERGRDFNFSLKWSEDAILMFLSAKPFTFGVFSKYGIATSKR